MNKLTLFLIGKQNIAVSAAHKIITILPEIKADTLDSISTSNFESVDFLRQILTHSNSEYILLQIKPGQININESDLNIWLDSSINDKISLSFSYYQDLINGEVIPHPLIKYNKGSIRDDFNFGPLILFKTEVLRNYLTINKVDFLYAGLYYFRLYLSRNGEISGINQYLYSYQEPDTRKSGEKQFDYVNPSNRERQIEMELAATKHLKCINAHVSPPFKSMNFREKDFENEASVIIPVYNRVKTLNDAINSVLNQKTNFKFNLIVIDNHSNDCTTELLNKIKDSRLIHIIPESNELGIGGCWNEGINHSRCGRFAVQLDSDDLYLDENTLQRVVDKFHEAQCAMVIGSYKMVNFDLEEIPPGIIDHKEWTDNNGPNNALRINGLGAPRAFYTPIIREIGFPNVSYGEDYAVAIKITRTYKVGRIFEPIYLCRRWNENSDSDLSIEKVNRYNTYKDELRTQEIEERIKLNILTKRLYEEDQCCKNT